MLKTNSKKARENIRAYILKHANEEIPATFPEAASEILRLFRSQKMNTPESRRYYRTEQDAFTDWASGLPSALDCCYYWNRSAVDDLGAILEETEEEKARFSESDAEKMLTYLIYRELLKGAK